VQGDLLELHGDVDAAADSPPLSDNDAGKRSRGDERRGPGELTT
jgi:hypothetical protein